MQAETATGSVTIYSMQGIEVGHGWGEVRFGRGTDGHRPPQIGLLRRMSWTEALPPPSEPQMYRIVFHGGPTFHGVFDEGAPDRTRDQATFTPTNRPGDRL